MGRAGRQRHIIKKESTSCAGSKQPNGETRIAGRWSRRCFPVQQRVYRREWRESNLRGRT